MTRDEYVEALASILSGDPERISEGNKKLYEAAVDHDVDDGWGGPHPSLALVDAEASLHRH